MVKFKKNSSILGLQISKGRKMRKGLIQLGLLCVFLLNLTAALAQDGKVKGKVTDKTSKEAVVGAGVILLGDDKVTPKNQKRTNVDGIYLFDPVEPGTYYI